MAREIYINLPIKNQGILNIGDLKDNEIYNFNITLTMDQKPINISLVNEVTLTIKKIRSVPAVIETSNVTIVNATKGKVKYILSGQEIGVYLAEVRIYTGIIRVSSKIIKYEIVKG